MLQGNILITFGSYYRAIVCMPSSSCSQHRDQTHAEETPEVRFFVTKNLVIVRPESIKVSKVLIQVLADTIQVSSVATLGTTLRKSVECHEDSA